MDIKIKKINFEGNILKVIKATVTEMRGINNNQKYDFDLGVTGTSIQKIAVVITHKNQKHC